VVGTGTVDRRRVHGARPRGLGLVSTAPIVAPDRHHITYPLTASLTGAS